MRTSLKRAPAAMLAAALALAAGASAAAQERLDLAGVWSGVLTTDSDPYWKIEDLVCFPGCPAVLRERMIAVAASGGPGPNQQAEDAQYVIDHLLSISTPEGQARFRAATEEEAALETYCEPYGMLRQAMNPLPMRIRDEGDRLVFEYEEWSLTRVVHLTDAPPPGPPSPLGHSVGRFEDGALVVETSNLTGDYYPLRQGAYADGATVVERYVVEEDPRRLVLELTITDPTTLTAPYVWRKTWLYTPDVELLEDSCGDVPGEF